MELIDKDLFGDARPKRVKVKSERCSVIGRQLMSVKNDTKQASGMRYHGDERTRGGLTRVGLEGQLVGRRQVAEVLEGPGQGQVVRLRGRGQNVVHPLGSLCGTHTQTLSRQPEPHHFLRQLAGHTAQLANQATKQEVWNLDVPADRTGHAPSRRSLPTLLRSQQLEPAELCRAATAKEAPDGLLQEFCLLLKYF